MSTKHFLFSVITAVYNTEEYLEEAIESILAQTLGFAEHIQLILVDDGSTDGSLGICKNYQERFPENIVVQEQDHRGVSAARNRGLEAVRGELVNFLDSDDIWEPNAFAEIFRKVREHPKLSVFAAPVLQFGARSGAHRLNHKFAQAADTVDIFCEHQYLQLHLASTIIRRRSIKERRLDPRLTIGEDACFLTAIILEAGGYGLVSSTNYWYRKRSNSTSSMDTGATDRGYYFETVEHYLQYVLDYSRALYHVAIPYVQSLVLYELSYRIPAKPSAILCSEEKAVYENSMLTLLNQIDEEIILTQEMLVAAHKLYFLSLRRAESLSKIKQEIQFRDKALWLYGKKIRHYRNEAKTLLKKVSIRSNELVLEGELFVLGNVDTLRIEFISGVSRFPAVMTITDDAESCSLFGDILKQYKGFTAVLPLQRLQKSGRIKATIFEQSASLSARFFFSGEDISRGGSDCLRIEQWCLSLSSGRKRLFLWQTSSAVPRAVVCVRRVVNRVIRTFKSLRLWKSISKRLQIIFER